MLQNLFHCLLALNIAKEKSKSKLFKIFTQSWLAFFRLDVHKLLYLALEISNFNRFYLGVELSPFFLRHSMTFSSADSSNARFQETSLSLSLSHSLSMFFLFPSLFFRISNYSKLVSPLALFLGIIFSHYFKYP